MPKIVIYCGAGVSVDSQLPAFTTGDNAVWNDTRVDDVCDFAAWRTAVRSTAGPQRINKFYEDYRDLVAAAQPNDFHQWAASIPNVQIITTNVDTLFERAGIPEKRVLHLHGTINKWRCVICRARFPAIGATPSRCPKHKCSTRYIKTDVSFYGEDCAETYSRAVAIIESLYSRDTLIMAGSSGRTFGAGQNKWNEAAEKGVRTVNINPDPSVLIHYPSAHPLQKGATESLADLNKILQI